MDEPSLKKLRPALDSGDETEIKKYANFYSQNLDMFYRISEYLNYEDLVFLLRSSRKLYVKVRNTDKMMSLLSFKLAGNFTDHVIQEFLVIYEYELNRNSMWNFMSQPLIFRDQNDHVVEVGFVLEQNHDQLVFKCNTKFIPDHDNMETANFEVYKQLLIKMNEMSRIEGLCDPNTEVDVIWADEGVYIEDDNPASLYGPTIRTVTPVEAFTRDNLKQNVKSISIMICEYIIYDLKYWDENWTYTNLTCSICDSPATARIEGTEIYVCSQACANNSSW